MGESLAAEIHWAWESWANPKMEEWFGTPEHEYQKTTDWFVKNLEPLAPWMIEQMRGIASGSGLDFVKIVLMNHYAVLWPACGLFCTSIAFPRLRDGGPLLAQNLDVGNVDLYFVARLSPAAGHATLSDGMYGMCWSPTGMNDRGLAVGSSNLSAPSVAVRKPLKNGAPCTMLPRMVLRQCGTTPEAIEYVQSLPPIVPLNAGYQLNVIDAAGRMAVIDKVGDRTLVRFCGDDASLTTNVSLDPDLEKWRVGEDPKYTPEYHGYRRAERIRRDIERLGGQPPELDWVQRLMSSHDEGAGRICRHGPECDGGYSRMSMLYAPEAGSLDITNGPPCQSEYQHFSLADGAA